MGPVEKFNAHVAEYMSAGNSRSQAVRLAVQRHPQDHYRYLCQVNGRSSGPHPRTLRRCQKDWGREF